MELELELDLMTTTVTAGGIKSNISRKALAHVCLDICGTIPAEGGRVIEITGEEASRCFRTTTMMTALEVARGYSGGRVVS